MFGNKHRCSSVPLQSSLLSMFVVLFIGLLHCVLIECTKGLAALPGKGTPKQKPPVVAATPHESAKPKAPCAGVYIIGHGNHGSNLWETSTHGTSAGQWEFAHAARLRSPSQPWPELGQLLSRVEPSFRSYTVSHHPLKFAVETQGGVVPTRGCVWPSFRCPFIPIGSH